MARKKAATTKEPVLPSTDDSSKAIKAAEMDTPVSSTGKIPVFQADMGNGLPAQAETLNPDRAK